MTDKQASEKIRALIKQGLTKQAGEIWHRYVHGEALERFRSSGAITSRHRRLLKLGICGNSQSRYSGDIEVI